MEWHPCSLSTISVQGNETMLTDTINHYARLFDDIHDDWVIEYRDLNGVSYDLDIENRTIILHNFGLNHDALMTSLYFKPQVILALAESLRMVRHVEWLDNMLHRYHPHSIILMGRICVADAMTHKIRVAWDMKCDDEDAAWKHLLCSDLSDMTVAFSNMLEKLLSSGFDNDIAYQKSMAASFNQWFADENRLKQCDHDTLNLMDDMIADHTTFQSQPLNHNTVSCMTLPYGDEKQSYLDSSLVKDILKNPYYSMIDDTINQSHFMQVVEDMNKFHIGGLTFNDADLAARFAFPDA